jgi:protein-tyrosine kinase
MGTVYKALIRANRWRPEERSIGRPFGIVQPSTANTRAEGPVASTASSVNEEHKPSDSDISSTPGAAAISIPTSNAAVPETAPAASMALGDFSMRRIDTEEIVDGIYVRSYTHRIFEEPSQIARAIDLSIDSGLPAIIGTDQLSVERYRTLATRLLELAARRRLKTILVTSAAESEGKSRVALNLSWLLAENTDRRILLIEANLPRVSFGKMLGVEPQRSWVELITNQCRFQDAAVRLDPNGLYLLMHRTTLAFTSASSVVDSTHLFSDARFEKLLMQLGASFGVIVIDAPALLNCTQARRLAAIADGTLLVVRAGSTNGDAVAQALALVPRNRQLGVVLNETDERGDPSRTRQGNKGRARFSFGRNRQNKD